MWHGKAKTEYPDTEGRRLLAVSDIHGNLEYFDGLLKKAGWNIQADELFIVGDFLEKGKSSLNVLKNVMDLYSKGHVHVIAGNCDTWSVMFSQNPVNDPRLLAYFRRMKCGIIWDMCESLGIDLENAKNLDECRRLLPQAYQKELTFLTSLNTAAETEHYIFVHSGMNRAKPLTENTQDEVLKHDFFRIDAPKAKPEDKWIIAGHTPVVLYRENTVNANPLIDREKKLISIDGGCVLKDDGQLNMLIIPYEGSEDFTFTYYDPFPEAIVEDTQEASEHSWYIRWGDNEVEVLERGEEFSRCRHTRTGYEADILTKYLFTRERITRCNDCTDYYLPLSPGDTVSIVEECSDRYFVKHNGISGWYKGRLKKI